jgi:hypothetical protein
MVEDIEKRESYSKKLPPHQWEGASRGEVVQRIHWVLKGGIEKNDIHRKVWKK